MIAKDIADTLNLEGYDDILEIGPGMGVLTKYLLNKPVTTYVIEIDTESVTYLDETYPKLKDKIISQDFLRYNINEIFEGKQFINFPTIFRHKLF
jgi:16S rRNA (adenine1518-N6/adenine1519-N6)-dimethyltransferase